MILLKLECGKQEGKGGGDFNSKTYFEVGNGRRVKFWMDTWCASLFRLCFP